MSDEVTTPSEWTLHSRIATHARQRPDHTAIICEDRETSYARLHRDSNRTAHGLLASGVRRGSRVAYLGRESEHYYEVALACAKTGGVLVPINWRLTPVEIDHILRDSDASVLFVAQNCRSAIDRITGDLPLLREVVALDLGGEPRAGFHRWRAEFPDHDVDPGTNTDDAVAQMYTSGTTGRPKGAVIAHHTFFTLATAMSAHGKSWLDWLPDDVSLVAFPGLSSAGFGWFMHGFVTGVTNVVMPMFLGEETLDLIARHRVTTTYAAPAMLHMMLAEPAATPDVFRPLRKVVYGGATMPQSLLRRCIDVLGFELAQIYASTETGSVATCLPPEDHRIDGPARRSAGKACPGNQIKIIDSDGEPLPHGRIGQVCVRTPARMIGYWRRPEATAQTLVDGWVLMGDAGWLDEHGYLHLVDRIDDTIIVAGQNIYPAEVEQALYAHPAVAEAAVIGTPDEQWGEVVHACVVLDQGQKAGGRELMVFLRGKIADFKIPTRYEFLDSLPRNPSGKVLRRVLRERHGHRRQDAVTGGRTAAATPGH